MINSTNWKWEMERLIRKWQFRRWYEPSDFAEFCFDRVATYDAKQRLRIIIY